MHQYHLPPCYGLLVYPPYMQMMYAWHIQIYLLYWTFVNIVVERIMILLTVEFPVSCAAMSFKQAKYWSSYPETMTMLFSVEQGLDMYLTEFCLYTLVEAGPDQPT